VWKDVVYSAICADGSCLPPVIITSDPSLKSFHIRNAKLIYIEAAKGESNRSTLYWFDAIKEYLEDDPLLLLDNHISHHSNLFVNEAEALSVRLEYFPPKLSALLSPLDNSFHSVFRRNYNAQPRQTHQDMIRAIVKAYYDVPDEHIKKFWQHVGILGKRSPRRVATALLEEGYSPVRATDIKENIRLYHNWRDHWALLHNKARKKNESVDILKGGIDHLHWCAQSRV
jgi:predicted RNA-binding protein